jgi:hypothetical protein
MNQTIIGVFDTLEQAKNAAVRLEGEGIARSDINLHRSDDSDETAISGARTTRDVTTGHTDHAHEGAMARIEHFFKRLFGDDQRPDEVGHFQEAVRRGGVLLSVEVRE